MARLLQFRRDTAANWASNNPTLALGEPAFETDTGYYKIGDGSTAYNTLAYLHGPAQKALEGLTTAADRMLLYTGSGTASLVTTTSYGRALLALANEAALKAALNLEADVDFDAYVAEHAQAVWEAGTNTTPTRVSPANAKASVQAHEAPQSGVPDARLYHKQNSGTSAASSAGSWNTYPLNYEVDPNSVIALSSSQFIPTADGFVDWEVFYINTAIFATRLYCVTDGAAVSPSGLVVFTYVGDAGDDGSTAGGCAEVESGKTYRLEYRCGASKANGLGVASGWGDEIYGILKYWKAHQG